MKTLNFLITGLLMCFFTFTSMAQTTVVLQPDASIGKDDMINSRLPDGINYPGVHPDLNAMAWTNSGELAILRSLIEFDLSSIPANAVVNSAFLSLYNNPTSPNNNGGEHSSLSGSNEAVLQRIVSIWEEYTVTWNNQPVTTIQNEVYLPQSTDPHQDYTNIDVTTLVQDMVDNPATSFGFMLKLQTEEIYRCLIFASSDNQDPSKHPKLVVTYSATTGVQETLDENSVKVYPNPTSNVVTVEFDNLTGDNFTVSLYDNLGRLVYEKTNITTNKFEFDINNLKSGAYHYQLVTENQLRKTGKLIIN